MYDEKDDFFDEFFNLNKENLNSIHDINREDENNEPFNEDELIKSMNDIHISKTQFKNCVNYSNFEDEELICQKEKKKVNSKGETNKIKNKINYLFNN